VGSRTAKNCHPDDGYICSSKLVKPLILDNPKNWKRDIIFTGNPFDVRNIEAEILQTADAKNDPRSFNMHNGDGKFTTAGKILPPFSIEHRNKIGKALTGRKNTWAKSGVENPNFGKRGRKHSEETKQQMGDRQRGAKNHMYGRLGELNPNFGRQHSEETRKKQSLAKLNGPLVFLYCSCILCKKELPTTTLNHHRAGRFCITYARPKMSCRFCKLEMWASSRHNHYRLSNCKSATFALQQTNQESQKID
jgi:hypothetical protein